MLNQNQQKIDWYQEVLNIEPSSRVFFPLAKLLVQDERKDEAIVILKKGLSFHPEYLEAKLFLLELVQNEAEVESEVKELSNVFGNYPKIWSLLSKQDIKNADLSCVLSMVNLMLKDDQASILNILSAGVSALNNEAIKIYPKTEAIAVQAPKEVDEVDEVETTQIVEPAKDQPKKIVGKLVFSAVPRVELSVKPVEKVEEKVEVSQNIVEPKDLVVNTVEDPKDNIDLKCSTYTRSMAELLAEQGDIAGALNILEKLLNQKEAQNDELAVLDIKKRIETLNAYNSDSNTQENSEAKIDLEDNNKTSKKDKTLSFLSNLASRLEARAASINLA